MIGGLDPRDLAKSLQASGVFADNYDSFGPAIDLAGTLVPKDLVPNMKPPCLIRTFDRRYIKDPAQFTGEERIISG